MSRTSSDDTWSAIFRPPPNESANEKHERIARQQEAARVSKEIDDGIEKSRKLYEKRKKAIKVLLLGQAESGKSTMLRNFQLAFCPTYFHREIPIWKIIIQLNLIGSVKRLLTIIDDELESQAAKHGQRPPASKSPSSGPGGPAPLVLTPGDDPLDGTIPDPETSQTPAQRSVARSSATSPRGHHSEHNDPPLTQAHSSLRLRLLPLLSIETNLARQLLPEFGGTSPPLYHSGSGWAKWASGGGDEATSGFALGSSELCVRAGSAWKSVLERVTGMTRSSSDVSEEPSHADDWLGQPIDPNKAPVHSAKHGTRTARPHPSDPTPLLEALAPDINALWTDPAVQALLKRKGVRLEDSAGFFLNDVMRIGKPGWQPGIDDIVRARLRTFGVEEHRFFMDNGSEWYIYDVGGSRGSRHQWVPYFDDVQAIIFLAPLVFNQVLDEDRMINRLEDSISLWKQVCANPLLARANIILFLNKMDILESTLKAGIKVQTYVPSYGSHPNELPNVVKYFRDKFRAYHKRLSPRQRTFFCHETSAIDTEATQAVLTGVREGILRNHLEKLSVI